MERTLYFAMLSLMARVEIVELPLVDEEGTETEAAGIFIDRPRVMRLAIDKLR